MSLILAAPGLGAASPEVTFVWSGFRVAHYGPFQSRSVDYQGLQFIHADEERPGLFYRAQVLPPASEGDLKSRGLSLGAEYRFENPDWFWGVGLGLDARVERIDQTSRALTVGSPMPREVVTEGFRMTLLRPLATLSVQWPGFFIFRPFAEMEGPVQLLTRVGVEYTLVQPKGRGAAAPFMENLDRLQYTIQVGLRFR